MSTEFDNLIQCLGLTDLNGYTYVKQIGAGGQGTVAMYQDDKGKQVAAKFLIAPGSKDSIRRLEREAEALERIANYSNKEDSIVSAYGNVQQVPYLPVHYFFMTLAPGDPLSKILEQRPAPWSLCDAIRAVWRIAAAIAPAHRAGFVHRDLHPGNIVFNDSEFRYDKDSAEGRMGVYILDFGVNAFIWQEMLKLSNIHTFRPVGSVRYASPEALTRPETVEPNSDMWSLGVLLYQLLTGTVPFEANTLRGLMDMTANTQFTPPTLINATEAEASITNYLLRHLLCPLPEDRLSISELTSIASDFLYFSLASYCSDKEFCKQYFEARGQLIGCMYCRRVAKFSSNRCSRCGSMDVEWLHWSSVAN